MRRATSTTALWFIDVLQRYYAGEQDVVTVSLLQEPGGSQR